MGLVYGCTAIPSEADVPLYQRPIFWAVVVCGRVRHSEYHLLVTPWLEAK